MIYTIHEIKKLWEKIPLDEDMNLYIHSPFCQCKCKYCLYSGKECNSQIEKNYFIQELKSSIFNFRDILKNRYVNTLYFGGGTPNIFSIEEIENITKTIYDICTPNKKIIELNPAYLTEEYLKKICELKYTLITFGIQTFDKSTLQYHNRPYVKKDTIKRYIDICKEYNVKTSIDLMCFLKSYTINDIQYLENDINTTKSLDVDFITIYPEQNLIKKDGKIAQQFSQYIESKINQKEHIDNYYIDISQYGKDNHKIENNPSLVYRYINNKYTYDFFRKNILSYYENDFPAAIHNIIAFGDKNCEQKIVSYSPKRFFYTEQFSYPESVYDIKYITDDFKDAKKE